MTFTIWGRLSSINVQKVMWALDEIGLAYEHIPAGGDFGLLDTPGFRAMNPHGWVPVIDDDGVVVWESHAILRYLCAEHSAGVLWPTTPGVRALGDQWLEWTATTLQPHVSGFFWGWYRTPEAQRNEARNAAMLAGAADDLGKLDAHLAQHPYVGGDHLTFADIPAGVLVYRHFEMPIERPPLPHVKAWYARLSQRPAYQLQVMRPFAELWGRLAY